MKKILLSSALLVLFALSIILFQLSCAKTAQAQQTSQTTTVLDKTLIQKSVQIQIGIATDSSGNPTPVKVYAAEYYTINNDGSNLTRINITLPAGSYPLAGLSSGYLSPDNKKLIFVASNASFQSSLYALTLSDGSLVKLIDNEGPDNSYQLLNTY